MSESNMDLRDLRRIKESLCDQTNRVQPSVKHNNTREEEGK